MLVQLVRSTIVPVGKNQSGSMELLSGINKIAEIFSISWKLLHL